MITRAVAEKRFPLDASGRITHGPYKGQKIYVPALHALVESRHAETASDAWGQYFECDCHGVKGCPCPWSICPEALLLQEYPELDPKTVYQIFVRKKTVAEL